MRATTNALAHDARQTLVSRGSFLKVLGAAVLWPWVDHPPLSAVVGELIDPRPGPDTTPFHLQDGSVALFRRHLHTTFLVRSDSGARVPLRLTSVVERSVCAELEQFSLIFDAPEGTGDLHGTRACEHHALGHLDLFIVPIGVTAARPRAYEACFSRFVRTRPGAEG